MTLFRRPRLTALQRLKAPYKVGPIFPLPFEEKKLDFSPSLVTRNVPTRKSTGTATKRRVAAAPKLVVSIETNGCSEKLSLNSDYNSESCQSSSWAVHITTRFTLQSVTALPQQQSKLPLILEGLH